MRTQKRRLVAIAKGNSEIDELSQRRRQVRGRAGLLGDACERCLHKRRRGRSPAVAVELEPRWAGPDSVHGNDCEQIVAERRRRAESVRAQPAPGTTVARQEYERV